MQIDRWQRIESFFRELIDLAPEDRAQRLEELLDEGPSGLALRDAPAIRAEVNSLLAAHDEVRGDFLEELDSQGASEILESIAGPCVPDRIGPYRVRNELGRGGMGVVYLADRVDGAFEQRVALKLIKRGMDTDSILRRFLYERQILARLEHPNIARLLDGGVTEEGQPWFAMELVGGVPLTVWSDQRRLPLDERIRLFEDVCGAVGYAHRNLVVHRDLKPSNVLVTPAGAVKLLDFGIAKLLASDDDRTTLLETEIGSRLATPEYCAPEQLRGEPISTATDVYSLGALLYELLCGAKPVALENRSLESALEAITQNEPVRPSSRLSDEAAVVRGPTKRQLERALRGDLDTIVLKALRKRPERRYSGSDELAEDLRRYRRGLPVHARPDRWSYRTGRFVRRHWLGVTMTTLLVTSLTLGLIGTTWQGRRATEERDRARAEAARTEQVKNFLIELFRATGPNVARGDELTAHDVLARGIARIDSEFEDQPDLRAELLATVANATIELGDPERGLQLYERAVPLVTESSPESELRRADLLNGLGEAYAHLSRLEEAEATHRAVLALRSHLGDDETVESAKSHNNLAVALAMQRKWREAELHYRRALEIQQRWLDADHIDNLMTSGNLATVLRNLGEYDASEELLRSVVERELTSLGADHPARLQTLNTLAGLLIVRGNYDESKSLYEDLIADANRVLGSEHPSTLLYKNNCAVLLLKLGDGVGAETLMRDVLAGDIQQFGTDHAYVAMDRDNLGRALTELGRFDEALALFDEAAAVHAVATGPAFLATSNLRRAETLLARGSLTEASVEVDRALAILHAEPDPELDKLAHAISVSAAIRMALNRRDDAERLYRDALAKQIGAFGEEHPETATVRFGLGNLLIEAGRFEEAERELEKAKDIWQETLPQDHWRHGDALVALGVCRRARGGIKTGDRLISEGLKRVEATRGPRDWRTLAIRRRVGDLETAGGSG